MAIVEMCDAPHAGEAMKAPHLQMLLNSIFLSLVVEAEREIRKRLADKLSTADWAPPALINVLALDDIEIARPVIAASPLLKDHDLVRLLVEATIEHQIEVARRPRLSQSVVSAILHQAEPEVLTALAGNPTADMSPADMAELVEISRQVSALRTPLSCHPKLTDALAERLYLWVGQALRQSLAERFRLDTDALDQAIASAVTEVKVGAPMPKASVLHDHDTEREEMERRLVEKLHLAGQLRPGYLVRALREVHLRARDTGPAGGRLRPLDRRRRDARRARHGLRVRRHRPQRLPDDPQPRAPAQPHQAPGRPGGRAQGDGRLRRPDPADVPASRRPGELARHRADRV
jgi:hypothetical protein